MLALICFGLCACSESDVPDDMKLASLDNVPFKLYVPKSWSDNTASGISSAYYSNSDRSNVQVTIHLAEEGVSSVDDYWEKASEDYAAAMTDFANVGEAEATVLGGLNAKKYVFGGKIGTTEYKYVQVISYANGSFYILTYTATPDNFDSHLEDVNRIIEAFKFK